MHPGVGPRLAQTVERFGVTGALARRKRLPGLLHLSSAGLIPGGRIFDASLDDVDVGGCRASARSALGKFSSRKVPDADWQAFVASLDGVPLAASLAALQAAVELAEPSFGAEAGGCIA